MNDRSPLPPDIDALLEHEREVAPLPPAVRARALARARAALVAGTPARSPARSAGATRLRWAAAAALVCMGGAAVGAVAYELRARFTLPRAQSAAPRSRIVAPPVLAVPEPAPVVAEAPAAPEAREAAHVSPAAALRAELGLLKQAREAVARADYASALPPIAEHLRRFKDGRLAEEREALRVKALAGLGRTDEAHRAAAAFRVRFPRSVLLPAVRQMPAGEPAP